MTLQDRIREWLGINIMIRQHADMVTRKTMASFELAARTRHEETMDALKRLENMLVIEAPKRKVTVTNGAMYSLEEAQSQALEQMLTEARSVQSPNR